MPEGPALWSGRFRHGPHDDLVALTASIETDMRLLPYDAAATKAHARALVAAGLLEASDLGSIDGALDELVELWEKGELVPAPGDEDVHTLVERELTERLGELGRRIHAGRSRNDLVATDLRLWCRDRAAACIDSLSDLITILAALGENEAGTVMPGYTHLQRAQPVSLGFHMLAHGFASLRDLQRFRAAYRAADTSPLGAGALAGNTLGLDPSIAAHELGFSAVFDNAMDAVSDRDFALDLLYAAAACGMHLSRLAEEIVLWSSAEFGFARIADDWSTGSSMMPQKRNPDMAELIRGRAAGVAGELAALLGVLKGLPLAYDRDMQQDKEHLFRGLDSLAGCIRGMTGLLGAVRFDRQAMADAAAASGAWATDVAEALVARGVAFRGAHEIVGRLVARLEDEARELAAVPDGWLAAHHGALGDEDRALADPRRSVAGRRGPGATAPERVVEAARALRRRLAAARGSS